MRGSDGLRPGRIQSVESLGELGDAERLQLLVDAVQDYAISLLGPDGFVVSWNPGAEKVNGYSAAEIVGRHFSGLFTAEDRANGLPARLLRTARETGRSESEVWRVRKDATQFWASVSLETVRNENGALLGFAEITRDISERRAAQEALRDSERQFRLLVDGVIDYAIYMLDPSGVVVSWNAGAERLKGYRAPEIIGQHFSRFYIKEDRAAGLPGLVLEAAARDGRYEMEGWRVRRDGSRFWASVVVDAIRDGGELVGFAKVTHDITERRAAQEALRESEREFRLLVEGVTDYALYMLDPNGIVTNWNAGAQRIKGYTSDEIVGQHFSRFYTEADRSAGLPLRALYAAAQEGRSEAEGWRVRKDGTLFWAHVIIDAIRDETGHLVGYAKITRDITEQRESQIELQKAQALREYTQKMETLGQLTGGVAHDFNNLLMIVSGHNEMLRRLVSGDAKGARASDAIGLAVKRGESLTRQLLTFARRQALNPVAASVAEQVDAVAALLTTPLGSSIKLVSSIPPDLWPVKIDVDEFELALVNIALNARDAMPDGGVITVIGENVELLPDDTPAQLRGEFVALTVADAGCGIATDILPKVFDPFFTTKRGSGTGLGLSQVHGFAHQSGGTVTIHSELGHGTRVNLYLPRAVAAAEPQAGEPEGATSASGTALLVEDNPDVAEVTAALLEQLGYEVRAVNDAETALKELEQHKFDLMVSDIVMAGAMDGLALARAIRQAQPQLPIVLVTGYTTSAALAEAEFTVLRKPYRLSELGRMVAKAVADARPPSNLVHLHPGRRTARQNSRC